MTEVEEARERWLVMRQLRDLGFTFKEIGRKFGITRQRAWRILKHGWRSAERQPSQRRRPAAFAEARELRAKGHTLKDIAAVVGVSATTVSGWTKDVERGPLIHSQDFHYTNGEPQHRTREAAG